MMSDPDDDRDGADGPAQSKPPVELPPSERIDGALADMIELDATPAPQGPGPIVAGPPALLADVKGGVIFRQEAPDGGDAGAGTRERPRTTERSCARLSAYFGLHVYGHSRAARALTDRGGVRWSALAPEFGMGTNGAIGLRIRVVDVARVPGTLTIRFTRTAPGAAAIPSITLHAASLADLLGQIAARPEVRLEPPPGIDGRRVTSRVEDVRATASWKPDDCADTAGVEESVRIAWSYAHPSTEFTDVRPPGGPRRWQRTAVVTGGTVLPEPRAGGGTHLTVPVNTYWIVDDVDRCCGDVGQHAVIQFVRHRWELNERPRKVGSDTFSLDVLQTELDKAHAAAAYDPTYTHTPEGEDQGAAPVVYPGANGGGRDAIVQIDRPGIDERLDARFRASGGWFDFQFISFLVCQRRPSVAASYLASGRVTQMLRYTIRVTYPGGGTEPTVDGEGPDMRSFDPCVDFGGLLADIDRRNRDVAKTGRLTDGFADPRGHSVAIPR